MPDFDFAKISTPIQLAATAIVVYLVFVRPIVRHKLAVFGETASAILTVMFNFTIFILIISALILSIFYDLSKESISKTGKLLPSIEFNHFERKEQKDLDRGKWFQQKIVSSERRLSNHTNYSITKGIEEGHSFYDNHCGLNFTVNNVNLEDRTAQIRIDPLSKSRDSLMLLREGGINYHVDGKTYSIYLTDAYRLQNKNFILLNILQ